MATELPPCNMEDSPNCWWDANTMGNGQGDSYVNYLDVIYPVTVNSDRFIQSATVNPESGELVIVLGNYWTAPTEEEPTAPPLEFSAFRLAPPTEEPEPQEPGPQEPIQVPVTEAPVVAPPATETPVTQPVTAPVTVESIQVPTEPPMTTLPATGPEDFDPLMAGLAVATIIAGAFIVASTRTKRPRG